MSTSIPTPYEQLGGETAVRELVDKFYDNMDALPEAALVRGLHAKSLRASRQKMFMFLSGWLGGPDLYTAEFGHPRLRRRHLPFSIGAEERDQWMLCMSLALNNLDIADALREQLIRSFWRTAEHMRNRDGEPAILGPAINIIGESRN